ncbi:MAG: putative transporter small subunit [Burkholderiaceae bacterium]|nr:putative transporter small subunit [Burkholderiaceae bacterium]
MSFLLTTYMLVWPVISAAVMMVLVVALFRDLRLARRNGDAMI